ncbi:MAG: xanthine dehydrogenase accessory protein XdhC [Gymnodinialimonas sp.]
MLVWADGQSGTIGGGRLEFDAVKMARKNIERQIVSSAKSVPLGPELGQCCGGAVTLSFELFSDPALTLSFPYAHPVMAALSPSAAVEEVIARGVTAPTLVDDWLVEPRTAPSQKLWIWGAGHVGRALVHILSPVQDIEITWIDTAADRFPQDVPGTVQQAIAADPPRLMPHAPSVAHHLIVTYSHEIDLALCHAALSHSFQTCGLIGSATKWARFRKRLQQLGHSDAQISRIMCPIGDPALGKHPQAIAIGVAARLLDSQTLKESANIASGGT